jgi:glucose-1-phosphate cytidylyltransferase
VLERDPLVKLARDAQLNIFKHTGFWACMDTQRDRDYLTGLVETGCPPWMK